MPAGGKFAGVRGTPRFPDPLRYSLHHSSLLGNATPSRLPPLSHLPPSDPPFPSSTDSCRPCAPTASAQRNPVPYWSSGQTSSPPRALVPPSSGPPDSGSGFPRSPDHRMLCYYIVPTHREKSRVTRTFTVTPGHGDSLLCSLRILPLPRPWQLLPLQLAATTGHQWTLADAAGRCDPMTAAKHIRTGFQWKSLGVSEERWFIRKISSLWTLAILPGNWAPNSLQRVLKRGEFGATTTAWEGIGGNAEKTPPESRE
ncbi:hypothetical protein R3P38DRAFT_2813867 [Favolaschia claudopus]|uniref:Uncharacterized protein n=1 Tax=Favolaschia claudopus TaxID=2862362 RepID=A0AAV9Z4F2_9AGAR